MLLLVYIGTEEDWKDLEYFYSCPCMDMSVWFESITLSAVLFSFSFHSLCLCFFHAVFIFIDVIFSLSV